MEEVEVNGYWPKIKRQTLQEMIVQQFWYEGVLEEPANVVYLKVNNGWFRLYFDYGIVLWRKDNEGLEDELASKKVTQATC